MPTTEYRVILTSTDDQNAPLDVVYPHTTDLQQARALVRTLSEAATVYAWWSSYEPWQRPVTAVRIEVRNITDWSPV